MVAIVFCGWQQLSLGVCVLRILLLRKVAYPRRCFLPAVLQLQFPSMRGIWLIDGDLGVFVGVCVRAKNLQVCLNNPFRGGINNENVSVLSKSINAVQTYLTRNVLIMSLARRPRQFFQVSLETIETGNGHSLSMSLTICAKFSSTTIILSISNTNRCLRVQAYAELG